jgi:hypothetical protein
MIANTRQSYQPLYGADKMNWKKAKDWVVTIATALLGLSLALDLVSWPAFAVLLWKDIVAAVNTPGIRFAITIGCALLALLLYGARRVAPQIYGIAEIFVGLAVCWAGLAPRPTESHEALAGVLAVAGGIYLIVEGIKNCKKTPAAV